MNPAEATGGFVGQRLGDLRICKGCPWGVLGGPWKVFGGPWGVLVAPWGSFGGSLGFLGEPWCIGFGKVLRLATGSILLEGSGAAGVIPSLRAWGPEGEGGEVNLSPESPYLWRGLPFVYILADLHASRPMASAD